jgi:endoglucanase
MLALICATAQGMPTDARYAHLARGVNLTRWFQYGSPLAIGPADRDLLKNAGLTSVRIAVAPQYLLPKWSSPEVIAKNLADLDSGIDLFLTAGMAVMLDFQADVDYLDYYLATPGAPAELVETWKTLAARYANRNPELLFFEIMNEPDNRFTQAAWDTEQRAALVAIRSVAPGHTVLLAPANWSGLDALLQMKPYEDPNVIYVLHYYLPMTFTHQGANWTGDPAIASLHDIPWPAFLANEQTNPIRYRDEDWDGSRPLWDMALAAEWERINHARVVVNEFGAYKPFAPADSRARWLRDVRTAIEQQGMGWAMWDYAAGFDLIDIKNGVRSIDPGVSAALGVSPWTATEPLRSEKTKPFGTPRTVQIGAQPDTRGYAEGIATADINGDGLPDVIVTPVTYPDFKDNPIQVFLNRGNGVFQPSTDPMPTQKFVSAIVVGKLGLFFPDREGQSSLLKGSLPVEVQSAKGGAAGRFKGNGPDDLVVFAKQTQFLRNDGKGRFRLDRQAFPETTDQFECGAFVGNDLIAFGTNEAKFFTNPRKPGNSIPIPPESGGPVIGGCTVVTDLNNDGRPDVIVAYTNDIIQILINDGHGKFHDEASTRLGPLPKSKRGLRRIALFKSMLVITRVGEAPLIRVNRGNGVFVDAGLNDKTNPFVVVPGDFNHDGFPDLVFGGGGNTPLTARFGRGPL